jgi:hypothetical protein
VLAVQDRRSLRAERHVAPDRPQCALAVDQPPVASRSTSSRCHALPSQWLMYSVPSGTQTSCALLAARPLKADLHQLGAREVLRGAALETAGTGVGSLGFGEPCDPQPMTTRSAARMPRTYTYRRRERLERRRG